MSRIFRRGELKQAIVIVLAALGDAHGYAIMSELEARVEGGWKASPGAIYPALLALVESGHLRGEEKDGVRIYSLTEAGRQAAENAGWERRWGSLTERAEESEQRMALGSLLDQFAAGSPLRRRLAHPEQQKAVESILERAHMEIERSLEEGESNG
jgi:DNA-binding PadR family transcriptional regulator